MSELAPPARKELDAELREPRLRERLANRLAAEIVSGRMAAGQTFPSAEEIVQAYGVSRTVARETVQTLSMLGLVRVQHGRRTEVLPRVEWDVLSSVVQEALRRGEAAAGPLIHDLYAFRLLVEPQAAAWTAERADEEALSALRELAATMSALAAAGAPTERVMAADRDFHDRIARASGNLLVAAVSHDIREVVTTLWTLSRLDADDVRAVAVQHEAIAEALSRRDSAAAAAAMREHLEWASSRDLGHLGA